MVGNEVLKKGFELKGNENRYVIEGVLGQGSFGITYIAKGWLKVTGTLGDDTIEAPVAVKEFFISDMNMEREASGCVRQMTKGGLAWKYAERFKTEALNLAKLQHENIVRVIDFIETNGTYYYVMRLVDGDSLDDYLKSKGPLHEEEALQYIKDCGAALTYMHAARVLHLDLKPKNIMRRKDGHIYLIDFGLSKQFGDDGKPESSTSIGYGTNGYAPIEQSTGKNTNEFQATLDVYALGATLYKLLTGKTPPEASDVMNDGLPKEFLNTAGVSEKVQNAIEHAMQPRRGERTQSIELFLKELGLQDATTPTTTHPDVEDDEGETIVKKSIEEESVFSEDIATHQKPTPFPMRKAFIGGGIALLAILGIWGGIALSSNQKEKPHTSEETLEEVIQEPATTTEADEKITVLPEEKELGVNKEEEEVASPSRTASEGSILMDEIEKKRHELSGKELNSETINEFYNYLMLVKKGIEQGLPVSGYQDIAHKLSAEYDRYIEYISDEETRTQIKQRKKDIEALK